MLDITLRGLVFSKYSSIAKFASEIGWSYTKAQRIVNGKQDPGELEISKMVHLLGITEDMFIPIFFPTLFTKCTNSNSIYHAS